MILDQVRKYLLKIYKIMKLKVCGMKHKDNIRDVARLQPDYLGFIFYEKSSRFFVGEIPKLPISTKKVGVFVDASIEYVLERANSFGLNAHHVIRKTHRV